MNIPFELHIALRYLLAKRRQTGISVISLLSILGVTVGVMAVIVALALMTGMQQELRDRILASQAHVYVWKVPGGIDDYHAEAAKLRAVPGVIGAAPAILGQGLGFAVGETVPIQIKGIDPQLEPQVTDIVSALQSGSLAKLAGDTGTLDGVLLGKELAAKLNVKVGDQISLLTPQGTLSPMGLFPRSKRLRVAGTFSLGWAEFDTTYGFVSLDVAKRLFDKDKVDLMQLRVNEIYAAPQIAESITAKFGQAYYVQDWADMNRSLFSALWLEKVAVSMAIGLIVMVAALNIVVSLILLVMEKNRDIAILKTMGTSARSVTAIFVMQGLIIGLAGTVAGAIGGLALCSVLDRYKLIRVPMDVYQVSYMPFRVLPKDFALVVVAAVVICLVATIYPSRQASSLDPARALRYE